MTKNLNIINVFLISVLIVSCGGDAEIANSADAKTTSGYSWAGVSQNYELSGTGLNSSTLTVNINNVTCEKFSSSATNTYLKVRCTNPTTAGSYDLNIVENGVNKKTIKVVVVDTPSGKGGYIKVNNTGEPISGDNSAYSGSDEVCVLQTRDNAGVYLSAYLIWEIKTTTGGRGKDDAKNFAMAESYANTYGGANPSGTICGSNKWRLPIISELNNLYDSSQSSPYINKNYFKDMSSKNSPNYCFWSNTISGSNYKIRCFNNSADSETGANDTVITRLVRVQ